MSRIKALARLIGEIPQGEFDAMRKQANATYAVAIGLEQISNTLEHILTALNIANGQQPPLSSSGRKL